MTKDTKQRQEKTVEEIAKEIVCKYFRSTKVGAFPNDEMMQIEFSEALAAERANGEKLHKEIAALREMLCRSADALAQAQHDIEAYRGALGYPIPGDHNGRLSDGNDPRCGLCDARERMLAQAQKEWTKWQSSYGILEARLAQAQKELDHAEMRERNYIEQSGRDTVTIKELRAKLSAKEAEVERKDVCLLKKDVCLLKFGRHLDMCHEHNGGLIVDCVCGFEAALRPGEGV